MGRLSALAITLLTLSVAFSLAGAGAEGPKPVHLDLQALANQKLDEPFHNSTFKENNLAGLETGKQTLGGVSFDIGKSMIQLGSLQLPDMPAKVEGVKADQKIIKLHILHATAFQTDDDMVIGYFIVHYADNSKETIEIVYGQDVRDWWFGEEDKDVTYGKVAWTGDNDNAKQSKKRLRLYLTTWKNPKPDMKVTTIDYLSADGTQCAPFCVAMTAEG